MLAKIDQLNLLPQLFTTIATPPAVYRELMAKSGFEANRLNIALTHFITVAEEAELTPKVQLATNHLDAGEQQTIALAYAWQQPVIIDERLGRQAARHLGLTVTGSVGVLLEAKKRALIPAIAPLLFSARQQGYWLSEELVSLATTMAGE